MKIQGIL